MYIVAIELQCVQTCIEVKRPYYENVHTMEAFDLKHYNNKAVILCGFLYIQLYVHCTYMCVISWLILVWSVSAAPQPKNHSRANRGRIRDLAERGRRKREEVDKSAPPLLRPSSSSSSSSAAGKYSHVNSKVSTNLEVCAEYLTVIQLN